eukprot:5824004-Amphidinium_carterae.1
MYNVYGYCSDDKQAPEKNRELLLEVLGSVASLGIPVYWAVTGTSNLRSSPLTWCTELPCNGQSVVLHGVDHGDNGTKIDWFLVSKALLPATGLEEALDYKPDHNMVQLPVALEKVSQGFRGQPWLRNSN